MSAEAGRHWVSPPRDSRSLIQSAKWFRWSIDRYGPGTPASMSAPFPRSQRSWENATPVVPFWTEKPDMSAAIRLVRVTIAEPKPSMARRIGLSCPVPSSERTSSERSRRRPFRAQVAVFSALVSAVSVIATPSATVAIAS